jgi:hypothetical protein
MILKLFRRQECTAAPYSNGSKGMRLNERDFVRRLEEVELFISYCTVLNSLFAARSVLTAILIEDSQCGL